MFLSPPTLQEQTDRKRCSELRLDEPRSERSGQPTRSRSRNHKQISLLEEMVMSKTRIARRFLLYHQNFRLQDKEISVALHSPTTERQCKRQYLTKLGFPILERGALRKLRPSLEAEVRKDAELRRRRRNHRRRHMQEDPVEYQSQSRSKEDQSKRNRRRA